MLREDERVSATGVILAGGKSSRMEKDKAFLPFRGRTFLETLVDRMHWIFREVLIVVDQCQKLGPGVWNQEIRCCEDLLKERGPLAALYTAMKYARFENLVVLTCDMPLVDGSLIDALIENAGDAPGICFERNGFLEPFPGIYRKSTMARIKCLLQKDLYSMNGFLKSAGVKGIPMPQGSQPLFLNINTPSEYQAFAEREIHG